MTNYFDQAGRALAKLAAEKMQVRDEDLIAEASLRGRLRLLFALNQDRAPETRPAAPVPRAPVGGMPAMGGAGGVGGAAGGQAQPQAAPMGATNMPSTQSPQPTM